MYTTNNRADEYVKPKLMETKGEIDKYIIIGGDFNNLISKTDRTSRHRIGKEIEDSTASSTNKIKSAFITHSIQQ